MANELLKAILNPGPPPTPETNPIVPGPDAPTGVLAPMFMVIAFHRVGTPGTAAFGAGGGAGLQGSRVHACGNPLAVAGIFAAVNKKSGAGTSRPSLCRKNWAPLACKETEAPGVVFWAVEGI